MNHNHTVVFMYYFRVGLTGNKITRRLAHKHSFHKTKTVQMSQGKCQHWRWCFSLKQTFNICNYFSEWEAKQISVTPSPTPFFSTQHKQEAAILTSPNLSCLDLEGLNIPAGQPLHHTSWETGEEKMLWCFFWNHTKTKAAHRFCIKMSSWHRMLN